MENFFLNKNSLLRMRLFNMYHFFLILIVFLLVALIVVNKEKFINMTKEKHKKLRLILAFLLIGTLIIKNVSLLYFNAFDWKKNLDIGFCGFTNIMFILYCITGSKKIYPICFTMTFIGPLLSILIPSFDISPLNYNFYSFIIMHHLIFIFNIMFMYIEGYTYSKKVFIKSIIFIFIYTILIYLFDIFTGAVYNHPLAFVNIKFVDYGIIKLLSYNYLTLILTFYFVASIMVIISKKTLIFLNKK